MEVSGSGPGCQVDIGVVIYETMTPQCGRSVGQVLVVRVDIGVVIYEAMTPSVEGQWFRSWLPEKIFKWCSTKQ